MGAQDPVVIVGVARTPLGAFLGELASLTAPQLGAAAIAAAVARSTIDPASIDEVFLGNVLPAGLGQAPARQAALAAGLPCSVPCTTISKVCGSGMRAIMLAHDALLAGSSQVVVAGGMESMSNAPYLLPKARSGQRMGHGQLIDHMLFDGLEDAYDIGTGGARRSMGSFGEACAARLGFSRADQDAYALASVARAQAAARDALFAWEITPLEIAARGATRRIDSDEGPRRIDPARIPELRPAFAHDGTITAASASSINDGAAALVLMQASRAAALGLPALARIVGHSAYAGAPEAFPTAPIGALERLYRRLAWAPEAIDLFEINEAFAMVPMAVMREHGIAHARMNVHGGACALGHPIGASGARIVVTLLAAMRARSAHRGVAALCIGGGEATALALEIP